MPQARQLCDQEPVGHALLGGGEVAGGDAPLCARKQRRAARVDAGGAQLLFLMGGFGSLGFLLCGALQTFKFDSSGFWSLATSL